MCGCWRWVSSGHRSTYHFCCVHIFSGEFYSTSLARCFCHCIRRKCLYIVQRWLGYELAAFHSKQKQMREDWAFRPALLTQKWHRLWTGAICWPRPGLHAVPSIKHITAHLPLDVAALALGVWWCRNQNEAIPKWIIIETVTFHTISIRSNLLGTENRIYDPFVDKCINGTAAAQCINHQQTHFMFERVDHISSGLIFITTNGVHWLERWS